MAIGDENVEEAIIVKVQKTAAPGEERNRGIAKASAKRNVGEIRVTIVAIESLVVVGERGDDYRSTLPSRL